jgi:hypothetical protein
MATRGRWYFTKIVFVSDAWRGFAQWSAEKKASDAGNEVIAISAIALPCLNIQPGTYFNTAVAFYDYISPRRHPISFRLGNLL